MKRTGAGGSPGLASFEVYQPGPHLWLMQSGVWKAALHEAPHSPKSKPCTDEAQPWEPFWLRVHRPGPRLSWKVWCHPSGLPQGLPQACLCPTPTPVFLPIPELPKLGVMVHARNPRLRRLRQKHGHKFKASLNYTARPCLKNLKTTKMLLPEPGAAVLLGDSGRA